MEALAISEANLDVLENNLGSVAQGLNGVVNNVNNISNQVNGLEDRVYDVTNNVKSLEEEIKNFMLEIKQNSIVGNARQSVMYSQSQLEKKYGHYDQIRRQLLGVIKASDMKILRRETLENMAQASLLQNSDYWLASALLALSAWYLNDKSLASKALKEAMSHDDEKTSLLFCLINLRLNRKNSSLKWLNRYLMNQDPVNMDNKIITILDAVTSGAFGIEAKQLVLNKIDLWIKELSSRSGYQEKEIIKWQNYLSSKLSPISDNEYYYLRKNCLEWDKIEKIISLSKTNNNILEQLKNIIDTDSRTYQGNNQIDKILTSLIYNYDQEELELQKEILKNKKIMDTNGNIEEALKKYEQEKSFFSERNNFYTHLTDIALNYEMTNSLINTRKLAISLSKNWIIQAYNNLIDPNFYNELPTITLKIGELTLLTKDGSNQHELEDQIDNYVDNTHNIKSNKFFIIKMLLSNVILLSLLYIVKNNYFFIILIILAGLTFDIFQTINYYSKNKQIKEEKKNLKQNYKTILYNTLLEVVQYKNIWFDTKNNNEKIINYLNSLNKDNYVNDFNRTINIGGN